MRGTKTLRQIFSAIPIPYQAFGVIALLGGFGPLVGASSGVLLGVWTTEQGWSHSAISFAIALSTLSFATAQPLVGMGIERFGERIVVAFSLVGVGVVLIATAAVQNVAQLWLAYLLLGLAGAGTSGVAYLKAIYARGNSSAGLESSILIASGAGAGFFMWPIAFSLGTEILGWRTSVVLVGSFVLLACLPACWRFFTLVGVQQSDEVVRSASADSSNDSYSPARADAPGLARVASYGALLAVCFFFFFGLQGIVVHFVPIVSESGYSLRQAATTASALGMVMVPVLLLAGSLGDRHSPGAVGAAHGLLAAAGIALLSYVHLMPHLAWVSVCALAIGFGVEILVPLIVRSRYGHAYFARRYAILFGCYTCGRALGPWVLGFWRDWTGEYSGLVMVYAVFVGISAVCLVAYGTGHQRK